MSNYVIIDADKLKLRIEELEEEQKQINEETEPISLNINLKKQILLREVLSQSTPLIPEIEKAFETGRKLTVDGFEEEDFKDYEDYISNLKLDIT